MKPPLYSPREVPLIQTVEAVMAPSKSMKTRLPLAAAGVLKRRRWKWRRTRALVVEAVPGEGEVGVRDDDSLEGGVVEGGGMGSLDFFGEEAPVAVEGEGGPSLGGGVGGEGREGGGGEEGGGGFEEVSSVHEFGDHSMRGDGGLSCGYTPSPAESMQSI